MNKSINEWVLSCITSLIHSALKEGLPPSLKHAIVTPVLKNRKLPADEPQNYRPISNLPLIAKLTEKLVSRQLLASFSA
jgi:hypothetical protein